MTAVNLVILVGNLTRDPEMRCTPQGRPVAKLSMAINETYRTKDGEKKESVCFIDVEAWDRQAETCGEYLKKGSLIMVEGSIALDQWDDKETGKKRSKHKIKAKRVQFLGGEQE